MIRARWKIGILLLLLAGPLGGCGIRNRPPALTLAYQFSDGGVYLVQNAYNARQRLTKTHAGRIFADTQEELFTSAACELRVTHPNSRELEAAFTLLRLRIHDGRGKFKLEIGPEGGELSWYGEEQTLESYLGPEAWRRYRELIRQPMAVVRVNSRGIQQADGKAGDTGLKINYALLQVLGKNRVIGGYVVRSLKVPPLLMIIFPGKKVRVRETWSTRSEDARAPARRGGIFQPVVTTFTLQSAAATGAILETQNRVEFSEADLQAVRRNLKWEDIQGLKFKQGALRMQGRETFLPGPGRPQAGDMTLRKQYSLSFKAEDWDLRETEQYHFSVQPRP